MSVRIPILGDLIPAGVPLARCAKIIGSEPAVLTSEFIVALNNFGRDKSTDSGKLLFDSDHIRPKAIEVNRLVNDREGRFKVRGVARHKQILRALLVLVVGIAIVLLIVVQLRYSG